MNSGKQQAPEVFLTGADGKMIQCCRCGWPVKRNEAYGADRAGHGAKRFWCSDCAVTPPEQMGRCVQCGKKRKLAVVFDGNPDLGWCNPCDLEIVRAEMAGVTR